MNCDVVLHSLCVLLMDFLVKYFNRSIIIYPYSIFHFVSLFLNDSKEPTKNCFVAYATIFFFSAFAQLNTFLKIVQKQQKNCFFVSKTHWTKSFYFSSLFFPSFCRRSLMLSGTKVMKKKLLTCASQMKEKKRNFNIIFNCYYLGVVAAAEADWNIVRDIPTDCYEWTYQSNTQPTKKRQKKIIKERKKSPKNCHFPRLT